MKTSRDVADRIGYASNSDAITEAIATLLADDDQVRQAAEVYIEAFTLYREGDASAAIVDAAERLLRQVIAPKISEELVEFGRRLDLPDEADELVERFGGDQQFAVVFFVDG